MRLGRVSWDRVRGWNSCEGVVVLAGVRDGSVVLCMGVSGWLCAVEVDGPVRHRLCTEAASTDSWNGVQRIPIFQPGCCGGLAPVDLLGT